MKTPSRLLNRTLAGLAIAAVFAPAGAQEEPDAAALKRPDSSVSLGAGIQTGNQRDRTIAEQYNGLREHRSWLLLDLDFNRRNDETGMWTRLYGRDLGLESREFGGSIERQGDWRLFGDYNEIVHHEVRTINSGMTGAGSTNPVVVRLGAAGTGSDLNFELKRKGLSLGGDKWIAPNLQFELVFRNEDKDGTRMWARGYDCAANVCGAAAQSAANQRWALLMIPEPVNFNSKQVDAKLNWSGQQFFVTAGYYGSFFTNANGNVTPTVPAILNGATYPGVAAPLAPANPAGVNPAGGTSLQNVLQTPMALAPDNQAHQFYATGNYAWTPKVRSTFKLAYTHATQNESYAGMGFTGAPIVTRSDLGGVVNTTLAQFGLTARPTTKLSLLGNFRYERKDDKTPIDLYNVDGALRWNNSHISSRRVNGKVEGSYLLPINVRATAGLDYERYTRELPGLDVTIGGITGIRGRTEELTARGELRRSISDFATGAVGVAHSVRTGSDWYALSNVPAQGVVYGSLYSYSQIYQRTGTFPYNMANRVRDKVKGNLDLQPMERLNVQLVGEGGHDSYDPPSQNGLRTGGMRLFSVDASYAFNDRWSVNAYGSVGQQTINDADRANYIAEVNNRTTAVGAGFTFKPSGVWEIGGRVTRVSDSTDYKLATETAALAAQAAVGLPTVQFLETRYAIYTRYAVSKQVDLRFDAGRIISVLNEWAWGFNGAPFTFQDNTTVTVLPHQSVTYGMARFIYRF